MNSHELFHTLHQLSRHLTNTLNEALKPLGLYGSQWSVIFVLKTKGSLSQKELCDYLFVEAPPMTRTIQRLVKQGYVRQVPGKDKREKLIQLTDVALKMFPEWERRVFETNQSILKHFPETSQEELLNLQKSWLQQLL
ncbi:MULTISPECIES: MarR family winged helix-turn-helix transcriptional regulator [Bacillaceae]|jgi:MarR family transcriptional regulator, transcriptional regulator for hemolysin|uniref:MarR family winged helix-turn-helix transcriptional regulator n=1 Tax=Bacillaceae TaxID=186817 RepID=UPI000A2ACB46|nr:MULTISPECIES: MarR family transcriptional regulator [unclassified Bacillus (in: firmicutes)]MBT2699480.1 MarR family transcriptional regulator [Bacillus sp. ISL-40]MBT2722011.1 MarR family transcriptional regulator [Bacillus sp. ISL-46]MBT2728974.1 MarR family transcriptional regulator [Bacillus sp. ISL-75]MBT2741641.1 MarR family transcriptional regulator [Bacillus sp. ISL-77]PGY15166.1 MarR family transcriptional regulator [Bacillus sp. AFS031507]